MTKSKLYNMLRDVCMSERLPLSGVSVVVAVIKLVWVSVIASFDMSDRAAGPKGSYYAIWKT